MPVLPALAASGLTVTVGAPQVMAATSTALLTGVDVTGPADPDTPTLVALSATGGTMTLPLATTSGVTMQGSAPRSDTGTLVFFGTLTQVNTAIDEVVFTTGLGSAAASVKVVALPYDGDDYRYNPVNGNVYRVAASGAAMTSTDGFADLNTSAEADTYRGLAGHLPYLRSQAATDYLEYWGEGKALATGALGQLDDAGVPGPGNAGLKRLWQWVAGGAGQTPVADIARCTNATGPCQAPTGFTPQAWQPWPSYGMPDASGASTEHIVYKMDDRIWASFNSIGTRDVYYEFDAATSGAPFPGGSVAVKQLPKPVAPPSKPPVKPAPVAYPGLARPGLMALGTASGFKPGATVRAVSTFGKTSVKADAKGVARYAVRVPVNRPNGTLTFTFTGPNPKSASRTVKVSKPLRAFPTVQFANRSAKVPAAASRALKKDVADLRVARTIRLTSWVGRTGATSANKKLAAQRIRETDKVLKALGLKAKVTYVVVTKPASKRNDAVNRRVTVSATG